MVHSGCSLWRDPAYTNNTTYLPPPTKNHIGLNSFFYTKSGLEGWLTLWGHTGCWVLGGMGEIIGEKVGCGGQSGFLLLPSFVIIRHTLQYKSSYEPFMRGVIVDIFDPSITWWNRTPQPVEDRWPTTRINNSSSAAPYELLNIKSLSTGPDNQKWTTVNKKVSLSFFFSSCYL